MGGRADEGCSALHEEGDPEPAGDPDLDSLGAWRSGSPELLRRGQLRDFPAHRFKLLDTVLPGTDLQPFPLAANNFLLGLAESSVDDSHAVVKFHDLPPQGST